MSEEKFSREEVAKHNQTGDGWIIINDDVYDMSKFGKLHPGGETVLRKAYGTDATELFYSLHRHEVLEKFGPKLLKGRVKDAEPRSEENMIKTAGDISEVPYAEAPFWRGYDSPYFNESHKRFRADLRQFLHKEIRPTAERLETSGEKIPNDIMQKLGDFGLLASRIGPGEHLKWAPKLPGDVKPEEFDVWHEMIAHEEISRLAAPGFTDGTGSGMVIGLPPVLQHGPEWMKERIGKEVLSGKERICLAITEPSVGSDVANIECSAKLSADGTHYIVEGQKKWITQGNDAKYFVTAVRTGGKGMMGLSLLLIERSEGVTTSTIKTSYSQSAGTALIDFDNVKVPKENLIGLENGAFIPIAANFVHERTMIVCYILSATRGILEETFKWLNQRKAFGQPLIKLPAVRAELGELIAAVEPVQAWYEAIVYQASKNGFEDIRLAGDVALLKYKATRTATFVSDKAVNLFGGRGLTQTGMGRLVERFKTSHQLASILGGSESVMLDMAVRYAARQMPKTAKL